MPTDVFEACFAITKTPSLKTVLDLTTEDANDSELLLKKLADATLQKEKLETQVQEYSSRLKATSGEMDALKVRCRQAVNDKYFAESNAWREKGERLARKQLAAELELNRVKKELEREQHMRQSLETRMNELERVERLLQSGREGVEGESLELTRRTKGAADQANEFYTFCHLLNSKLREQTKANERLKTTEEELREKVSRLTLELQYLRKPRGGEREEARHPYSFVPASDLKRVRDFSDPISEITNVQPPKRPKPVPTLMLKKE